MYQVFDKQKPAPFRKWKDAKHGMYCFVRDEIEHDHGCVCLI